MKRSGPMAATRVLDLIDGLGAYGPTLLHGLGAEVIRVEPPGGSPQRSASPLHDGEGPHHAVRSLHFLHYNAGKKAITLDIESGSGWELLSRLLDAVDVVFDNGQLAAGGLDLDRLAAKSPPLVIVSVTPFGLTGERSRWRAGDLVCQAMSGMIGYYGYRNERPARFGPHQASELSGLAAALAALIGLFQARQSGAGEAIDIAAERVCALVTLQMQNASIYHQFGFKRLRHERGAGAEGDGGVFEACDGRLQMGPFRTPETLLRVLGRFDAAAGLDEVVRDLPPTEIGRHPRVREAIQRFTSRMTRDEVTRAVQAEGVICVPLNDAADLLSDPFLQSRGFFADVELADGTTVQDTGVPVRFGKTPYEAGGRAPDIGEHNAEVYSMIGLDEREIEGLRAEGVI